MGCVKIKFNENFYKNTQFYEYLGMGMDIDTQFLGHWVLSMGWVGIAKPKLGLFQYIFVNIQSFEFN